MRLVEKGGRRAQNTYLIGLLHVKPFRFRFNGPINRMNHSINSIVIAGCRSQFQMLLNDLNINKLFSSPSFLSFFRFWHIKLTMFTLGLVGESGTLACWPKVYTFWQLNSGASVSLIQHATKISSTIGENRVRRMFCSQIYLSRFAPNSH